MLMAEKAPSSSRFEIEVSLWLSLVAMMKA
jgi:hypothetical protein